MSLGLVSITVRRIYPASRSKADRLHTEGGVSKSASNDPQRQLVDRPLIFCAVLDRLLGVK